MNRYNDPIGTKEWRPGDWFFVLVVLFAVWWGFTMSFPPAQQPISSQPVILRTQDETGQLLREQSK